MKRDHSGGGIHVAGLRGAAARRQRQGLGQAATSTWLRWSPEACDERDARLQIRRPRWVVDEKRVGARTSHGKVAGISSAAACCCGGYGVKPASRKPATRLVCWSGGYGAKQSGSVNSAVETP
ncbi:hypothetical protein ACJRO7_014633 [Eucalyptus globulus]